MSSFEVVFEKYWLYTVLLMLLYLLIIFIIETKDGSFSSVKTLFNKQEYRKNEDWSKFNYQFLRVYEYYRILPPESLTKEIETGEILELKSSINDSFDHSHKIDLNQVKDEELKMFLTNYLVWFNQYIKPRNRFLHMFNFRKNKRIYKHLFQKFLVIERKFYQEFEAELLNFEIDLELDIYK